MKHKGVRPVNPLIRELDKRKRVTYYEEFDDGSYKIWNNRLLNSGCGGKLTEVLEDGDLLYCPHCREWCNKNQFEE